MLRFVAVLVALGCLTAACAAQAGPGGGVPVGQPGAAAQSTQAAPDWLATPVSDVNTGQAFKLADFQGKVVLVEDMAIWCTTCLQQQPQVQSLRQTLAGREDFTNVTLDVDPNEKGDALKKYTAQHAFKGTYAIAGPELARGIARTLGDQFLNPTSAPLFVIDRQGVPHALPFGVKSAATLEQAVRAYLD